MVTNTGAVQEMVQRMEVLAYDVMPALRLAM